VQYRIDPSRGNIVAHAIGLPLAALDFPAASTISPRPLGSELACYLTAQFVAVFFGDGLGCETRRVISSTEAK